MNPLMPQMMINYPYGIPQARPVTLPNQIQYSFPQMQPQLFYQINPTHIQAPQNPAQTFINTQVVNQYQTQVQLQNEQAVKSQINTENASTKTETNSSNSSEDNEDNSQ